MSARVSIVVLAPIARLRGRLPSALDADGHLLPPRYAAGWRPGRWATATAAPAAIAATASMPAAPIPASPQSKPSSATALGSATTSGEDTGGAIEFRLPP